MGKKAINSRCIVRIMCYSAEALELNLAICNLKTSADIAIWSSFFARLVCGWRVDMVRGHSAIGAVTKLITWVRVICEQGLASLGTVLQVMMVEAEGLAGKGKRATDPHST